MLKDKGYTNDNSRLVSLEEEYLHGSLRERKIQAIKSIRETTNAGLKDAKDLSEIWDGTLEIYGREKLLESFGYIMADQREKNKEVERQKVAESWIEISEGTYLRIDQITFVAFRLDCINIGCGSDPNIPIEADEPNYWVTREKLLKLVGAKVEKEKIDEKDKVGRRFKID